MTGRGHGRADLAVVIHALRSRTVTARGKDER